jgi:uncharacterized protein YhjY with autotransporter beta-barrel domain
MASSINASTSSGIVQTADTSGILNLQSNGTTVASVSSTGVAVTGTLSASGGIAKASLPTGSVLQVVNAIYSTPTSNSTQTFADTGLTATITPTSATSKILVLISHPSNYKGSGNLSNDLGFRLMRGASVLSVFGVSLGYTNSLVTGYLSVSYTYLDSPATTSATTYKTQFKNHDANAAVVTVQSDSTPSTITLMEIAA